MQVRKCEETSFLHIVSIGIGGPGGEGSRRGVCLVDGPHTCRGEVLGRPGQPAYSTVSNELVIISISIIAVCFVIQLLQRVERIQNYAMRIFCSQPPRIPSEGLRSLNCMTLVKR